LLSDREKGGGAATKLAALVLRLYGRWSGRGSRGINPDEKSAGRYLREKSLQIETGATGLEPATFGVTGRRFY
jgi:hypothetical protein